MKHKVIITKDNKKVVVDETAEIRKGDSYIDFLVHPDLIETPLIYGGISYTNDLSSQTIKSKKIIATINHSVNLNVPMVTVEDEAEGLVKEASVAKFVLTNPSLSNSDYKRGWESGFVGGYKAAQQKDGYSEEDLSKAFRCGQQWGYGVNQHKDPENFKQLIESLKQEYVDLEMECDYLIQCSCTSNKNCLKPIIKTNIVDGQLIAYIKK